MWCMTGSPVTKKILGVAVVVFGALSLLLGATPALAGDSWSPETELAEIQKEIAETGADWEARITNASFIPPEERRAQLCGYAPAPPDRPMKSIAETIPLPGRDLPESWDWRTMDGTTPAKDQYGCGSCWAFTAVGALEAAYRIAFGQIQLFSEQQCISCNEDGAGCNGGFQETCYDLWSWFGAVTESCFPYTSNDNTPCTMSECPIPVRVLEYTSSGTSMDAMKTAIMTHPIGVSVYAANSMFYYGGGCYSGPNAETDHTVLLCGWDDNECGGDGAWLVKNSWGDDWGMEGFGWFRYGTCGLTGPGYTLDLEKATNQRVAYRDHAVLDANGYLDPGETCTIEITVTNYAWGSANNVTATLTSLTPGITVIDDTASFPNLGIWATGTSDAPHFTVEVGSGVDQGTVAEFELVTECDGDGYTSQFRDFISEVTVIYENDFEGDVTGWSQVPAGGDWMLGEPHVFNNHWDPYDCFSGTHLYGTDLNTHPYLYDGLYANSVTRNYLQSPSIDCSGQSGVHLFFRRWLTNENAEWDQARIRVGGVVSWINDETDWHLDRYWVPMILDISDVADSNAAVTISFDQLSDEFWKFGGWNIDDFKIVATNAVGQGVDDEDDLAAVGLRVQTYPNPFAPAATLRFAVPNGADQATLQIFDANGRMVRSIHEGSVTPGTHVFTWTGTDEAGSSVPAGTYYCRASADGQSSVSKMIRLR